jgi:hypothetical protein
VIRREERRLVARRSQPHDDRTVLVQLTRRGRRVADTFLIDVQFGIELATSPPPVIATSGEASNARSLVAPKRDRTKGDGTLRDGSSRARDSRTCTIRLGHLRAQGGRIKAFEGVRFARNRTAHNRPRVRSCLASTQLGNQRVVRCEPITRATMAPTRGRPDETSSHFRQ